MKAYAGWWSCQPKTMMISAHAAAMPAACAEAAAGCFYQAACHQGACSHERVHPAQHAAPIIKVFLHRTLWPRRMDAWSYESSTPSWGQW
jgi:hypothetical protein